MWTPATRGRMAKIEKKTKRYPSDLTDEEWVRIQPFPPRASKAGRPIEVDLREVLNAIRYMARSGGGWRMLPNDFPPWQTVYWWLRRNPPVRAAVQAVFGFLAEGFLAQRLASAATLVLSVSASNAFGSKSSLSHSKVSAWRSCFGSASASSISP